MGYNIKNLNSVKAIQIPTRIKKSDLCKFGVNEEEYDQFVKFKKADAQISIIIKIGNILKIENLSLKKANKNADYNQIDKRAVANYQEMWKFEDDVSFWLKLFTGELNPKKYTEKTSTKIFRDNRRLFLNEMSEIIQNKIIKFFKRNIIVIISDIIRGRGGLSADWMLVTRLDRVNNTTTWTLIDINTVMNFLGKGEVCISTRGSLHIGKITLQRKGGTPDPTKLQFKMKPCQLFNLEK